MEIEQGSFATPLAIKTALDGEDKYLDMQKLYANYADNPSSVDFLIKYKEMGTGSTSSILWDKTKSTEDEIYFVLPSAMFVKLKRYRCTLKIRIDGITDYSIRYFLINVRPKKNN